MGILINRQIPALYNGVSQQPPTVRLPSQCEELVNFYPNVVDGLRRRPPAEYVAKITSADLSGAHLHIINRDANERYIVVLTNGDLKVFDLNGVEQVVAFPHGKAYLNVTNAKSDFAAVTVADYTFIVNKTKVVEMADVGSDQVPQPVDYWWLNREYLGDFVYYQPFFAQPYNAAAPVFPYQYQYPPNPAGGIFRGVKQSFNDLPHPDDPSPPQEGDIWQIAGTHESGFATYYVRRTGGVWNETVKPGIKNRIDATTMPHALVRKADGTFEFGPFSWADRRVGDETTNPNPTFVGRRIRDVFFYKNRLGFCVDENIVLSRAGDFGNFYRLTVLDQLDDDVIDTAASETKVTQLLYAVPFDVGMMAFADQVQFRLTHGDVLRPSSAALDVATQYKMVERVRPLPLGSDVYFASENGEWAKIWEYYVRDDSQSGDAGDITAHVPHYIPAGVSRLAGSVEHDVLFVLTDGAPNRAYVYKFYWMNESEKGQSAWGHWQFGAEDTILALDVLDNYVYLITKRAGGVYLERMALESGATAPGLDFQIFLDRRVAVKGTFLSLEGKTEFTLPYPVAAADRAMFRIVRGPAFATAKGAIISVNADDYEWVADNVVKVVGDFSAGDCFAGLLFESRFRFSAQFMRNAQDVPITGGTLILNSYNVYFTNTAYFRTEVAPYGTDPDVEIIIPAQLAEFDGKTLGDEHLVIGEPVFATDSFRFEVFGDARVASVSLVNDSPYASTFTQAEWEGMWHNRSRTV